MTSRHLAAVLLSSVLVCGCGSAPAPTTASTSKATHAEPTNKSDTGSDTGKKAPFSPG